MYVKRSLERLFSTGRRLWVLVAAKAVVVGMTSNGFTLADPNDREMLDALVSTCLCRP